MCHTYTYILHHFATFTHTRLFPPKTAYSSAFFDYLALNSLLARLSQNICIFHTFSQHNRISHTRLRSSRALKTPPPFFSSDADGYVRAMAPCAIRPLATPIAGFAANTATRFVGLWRTAPYALWLRLLPALPPIRLR